MNYKNLAAEILALVGGEKNVAMVTHCATRLRFNLKDSKKADTSALKETEGVLGVVEKSGQYQVVIGNDVPNVFKELTALGKFSTEASSDDSGEKKSILNTVFDTISGIFTPFLPALTGAGMIKAVMALLVAFNLVDRNSQLYSILNFIADSAFYFMPILLAYSAAQKFKTNPYLAMTLGGVLLHPSFLSMVNAAKESGDPLRFLGVPIPLVSYSSSVIPIILTVWLMSYVHRLADKISPKIIKFFTVPLITLIITAPIMLTLIGPLGSYIGNVVASGIAILDARASWLTPLIIGAFSPLLVMAGMHYAIIPFGVNNLATLGYDTLVGPGMLASNVAQGGAALAVALKTKNFNLKQLAYSAGVTAVCGITEPAMYGVTLKLKKPLYAVIIGGGLGGLFAGIFGVRRFMSGSPGLLTLPAYLGDPLSNFFFAVGTCAISFVGAFVVTLILGFEDPKSPEQKSAPALEPTREEKRPGKKTTLCAPVSGAVIPLSEVDDPTFSTEVLGKGAAVIPNSGRVVSPAHATVITVYDTNHAICLVSDDGAEILIHIGLDTVRLKGNYFSCKVKEGQKVALGDLLIEFDLQKLKEEGYDTVTPLIVSNADDYSEIKVTATGTIDTTKELLSLC